MVFWLWFGSSATTDVERLFFWFIGFMIYYFVAMRLRCAKRCGGLRVVTAVLIQLSQPSWKKQTFSRAYSQGALQGPNTLRPDTQ